MATTASGMREQIERWFARQGLPLFIQEYRNRRSMRRAGLVLICLWFIEALILAPNRSYSLAFNVLAVVASLALLVGAAYVVGILRDHLRPAAMIACAVATFVLVLAFIPLLFGWQLRDAALTATINMGLVILMWLLIGGIVPVVIWSIREARRQVFHLLSVLARALPVLFVAVTLLFLTSEIWQIAANLDVLFLLAVSGLFVVIGTLCLIKQLVREVSNCCEEAAKLDSTPLVQRVEGINSKSAKFFKELADLHVQSQFPKRPSPISVPANSQFVPICPKASRRGPAPSDHAGPGQEPESSDSHVRTLRTDRDNDRALPSPTLLQRINIGVVLLFAESLQILVVSAVLAVFFVVFGLLAIPSSTATGYLGGAAPHAMPGLPHPTLWGQPIVLEQELVKVTVIIALFSYLSFVFYAATEDGYVREFLTHVDGRIRDVLAVHRIYSSTLWAPRRELVNRGRGYQLTFEVPAMLGAKEAMVVDSRDEGAIAPLKLDLQDNGRFTGQLILSAGTRFQYHYLINDKPYKDHGADSYVRDGAGIEQSVLQLDSPRRARRVANMTGQALRNATTQ